ncbi:hypothetical protein [Pontimicrobium sp. MEBiC01747]
MSSFLWAIGVRISLLCSALLMLYASSKVQYEYKIIFKNISLLLLFVASFFIAHILLPKKQLFNSKDFPAYFYWLAIILISISSVKIFKLFETLMNFTENKFKSTISNIFKYIGDNMHAIKDEEKEDQDIKRGKIIKETIENVR